MKNALNIYNKSMVRLVYASLVLYMLFIVPVRFLFATGSFSISPKEAVPDI
jgi:hypothetical protein